MEPGDILGMIPSNFSDPLGLGINIILSTLIGGILLLIILEIIGKEFSEPINPINAFVLVLIINLINMFGVIFILSPYIAFIPFYSIIIPLLVWILLVKLLFREMAILHVVIVALVGYFVTLLLLPYLVSMARAFIPI